MDNRQLPTAEGVWWRWRPLMAARNEASSPHRDAAWAERGAQLPRSVEVDGMRERENKGGGGIHLFPSVGQVTATGLSDTIPAASGNSFTESRSRATICMYRLAQRCLMMSQRVVSLHHYYRQ